MIKRALFLAFFTSYSALGIAHPFPQRVELPGKKWILRQLGGEPVRRTDPEAATISLMTNHAVAGTVSCNHVDGKEVTWFAGPSGRKGLFKHNKREPTLMTVMGCSDPAPGQLGGRLWEQMRLSRTWSVTMTTLTITFSDGSTAIFVPLVNH